MAVKRKTNKRKYTFNIGTLIFLAVFIYMIYTVFAYMTTEHIESYQVLEGPLSRNKTCTALILREERVVPASSSGTITYYARENAKVAKKGPVYTLGDSMELPNVEEFSKKDLSRLHTSLAGFASSFSTEDFSKLYNFKHQFAGMILQYSELKRDEETGDIVLPRGQRLYSSVDDGVIIYGMDGFEELDPASVTEGLFKQKDYTLTNFHQNTQVQAGDPVYKLITSETWSVVFPVTAQEKAKLETLKNVRVRFLKDENSQMGEVSVFSNENKENFCKITFENGMIRYAVDRFVDIELVTNITTGLKLPLSAIVTKDFYAVPVEFAITSDNGIGFHKKREHEKGEESIEFVDATIYEKDDKYYYVDTDDFTEGDVIIKEDSQKTFTIKDTRPLEGVYCTNKGYAVFRKIKMLEKNRQYCIVETDTPYGLSEFDYIVKDGSVVQEEDILYK